jgi:alpha-beta hydrolase superfamily lysophospholipase
VPVIDARTVLQDKDKVLWTKHAAIVLAHDIGQRRDQLLGLVKPLHDAGYVVLALNLRGGGKRAAAGETFGLHESADIRAAVEMLRRRPFVDPEKVAVIGYGTGATAALLAARADEQIAAVVADHPMRDGRELVKSRLLPRAAWVGWMAPLCKWTFELSYGVDVNELQISNFRKLFDTRPVLLIDAPGQYSDPSDPRTVAQLTTFLGSALSKDRAMAGIK